MLSKIEGIKSKRYKVFEKVFEVSNSFIIERMRTVATFKVKLHISSSVKCEAMKCSKKNSQSQDRRDNNSRYSKKNCLYLETRFQSFLSPAYPVSFCFNLSVHQPFLPIKNISSYFPPILWVYLGLFISVTPFSFITLCQSISLTLSLSLSRPDFSCTLSASDRSQEQHVFSEFPFLFMAPKDTPKNINIS